MRVGDSFMYAHLLADGPSQVPEALAIIALLLESATAGHRRHEVLEEGHGLAG